MWLKNGEQSGGLGRRVTGCLFGHSAQKVPGRE